MATFFVILKSYRDEKNFSTMRSIKISEKAMRSIIIGGVVSLLLFIILAFFPIIPPTKEYSISVDPVVSMQFNSQVTHLTIKNTGSKPLTNVRIDYGSKAEPFVIPVLEPGSRMMLSPPPNADPNTVRVTTDEGIDIKKSYRKPISPPLGIGAFG